MPDYPKIALHMPYRNKKTGKIHYPLAYAQDATTGRGDALAIVYCEEENELVFFVRDAVEFAEEFERVKR